MPDALKEFSKNLSDAAKELSQREQIKENLDKDIADGARTRDQLRKQNNEMRKFVDDAEVAIREGKKKHEQLIEAENVKLQSRIADVKKSEESASSKNNDLTKREQTLERQKALFKDEVAAYKNSALTNSERYKKLLADLGI